MKEEWLDLDTMDAVPAVDANEDELIVHGNVAIPEAQADYEVLEEVRHTGTDEIVSIEEEQRDALYKELLASRRAVDTLTERVTRLEEIVRSLLDKQS